MGIVESTDTFGTVVERYAPDGDEIEVLIMETDEWAVPPDGDLFAPAGEFADHTDFPLHPPKTGMEYDYVIAREPVGDDPTYPDDFIVLSNEDFAEDPPDWYERELPEWLDEVQQE